MNNRSITARSGATTKTRSRTRNGPGLPSPPPATTVASRRRSVRTPTQTETPSQVASADSYTGSAASNGEAGGARSGKRTWRTDSAMSGGSRAVSNSGMASVIRRVSSFGAHRTRTSFVGGRSTVWPPQACTGRRVVTARPGPSTTSMSTHGVSSRARQRVQAGLRYDHRVTLPPGFRHRPCSRRAPVARTPDARARDSLRRSRAPD